MVYHFGILGLEATAGEKKVKSLLNSIYKEDVSVHCYYEPPLRHYRPDFLVMGNHIGILIIEIKDYFSKTIKCPAGMGKWLKSDGTNITNPYDQIYNYWRDVKEKIGHVAILKKCNIPIKRIIVFSNISDENAEDKDIADMITAAKPDLINVCFKEGLKSSKSFENFLKGIIPSKLNISSKIFNLLKANIVPSCRLPQNTQIKLTNWLSHTEDVKLLDVKQEKMAHELGNGHRLFYGVAGSGKTVLLVARTRYLALKHPDWNILVLCYNKILSKSLFQLINPQEYEAFITVKNFHSWASQFIKNCGDYDEMYDKTFEKSKREDTLSLFFDEFVPKMLTIIRNHSDYYYDAILIDEGQDFSIDWFNAVIPYLNPDTNSLFITLDGLQGIYARKKLKWVDCGINAKGRVKKFKKSYRTPKEVGKVAINSLPNSLINLINSHGDEYLETTDFMGMKGDTQFVFAENRIEECEKIVQIIENLQEINKNRELKILILFLRNLQNYGKTHTLINILDNKEINWHYIDEWVEKSDSVFIGNLHRSKGLESEVVIIPELDSYKSEKNRQLLYVGITRTLQKLVLTYTKETNLVKKLKGEIIIKKEIPLEISHDNKNKLYI